jgi:hypothetical protein
MRSSSAGPMRAPPSWGPGHGASRDPRPRAGLEGYRLRPVDVGRDVGIVNDDATEPDGMQQLGGSAPDTAETDHTRRHRRRKVEWGGGKRTPSHRADQPVGLTEASVGGEGESQGVLGDGLGPVVGHVGDGVAERPGGSRSTLSTPIPDRTSARQVRRFSTSAVNLGREPMRITSASPASSTISSGVAPGPATISTPDEHTFLDDEIRIPGAENGDDAHEWLAENMPTL